MGREKGEMESGLCGYEIWNGLGSVQKFLLRCTHADSAPDFAEIRVNLLSKI